MVEYISENLWLVWFVITMLCLILELSSGDFYVTCFAIGSLCGMVSSWLGWPLWLQVLVFAAMSVLSIRLIRPRLLRRLHKAGEERASNADALVGREGTVAEEIPATKSGYVKIDGDMWRARTADGTAVACGERVRVVSRESTIVTVEKI